MKTIDQKCGSHKEQYIMDGICENCSAKFILKIPKTHQRPYDWVCTECGCEKVRATTQIIQSAIEL
jgi:hypothetical protein